MRFPSCRSLLPFALLAGVLAGPWRALGEEPQAPPDPAPTKTREVVISLGYRAWFEKTAGEDAIPEEGYTLLHGPVLGVAYRGLGLSVTYLQGGGSAQGLLLGSDLPEPVLVQAKTEREDFDLALSYRVLGFLRPFVGYKIVNVPSVLRFPAAPEVLSADIAETYRGPTFGFNAILRPFKDDRFFVSGTFLYGPMRVRIEERTHLTDGTTVGRSSEGFSVHGVSWDVALGSSLGHGLLATAGYRAQFVRRNPDVGTGPERIEGPVFALVYSF